MSSFSKSAASLVFAFAALAAATPAHAVPAAGTSAAEPVAVRLLGQLADGLRSVGRQVWHFEPAAGSPTRLLNTPVVRPAPQPAGHGAFESVAIPVGNIPMAAKWSGARARDYSGFFTSECSALGFANCSSPFARSLRSAVADAEGLSQLAMLRLVNQRVNGAIRYQSDQANWGVGDRWSTPSEIARNGRGDCEDYALTKMWMLKALGFSEDQLQLVVLQDTARRLYHAVLVAHVGGHRYILDNLSGSVRLDNEIANYLPLVSFVAGKNFIHGFDQRRTTVAMPTDLASVTPGEGI